MPPTARTTHHPRETQTPVLSPQTVISFDSVRPPYSEGSRPVGDPSKATPGGSSLHPPWTLDRSVRARTTSTNRHRVSTHPTGVTGDAGDGGSSRGEGAVGATTHRVAHGGSTSGTDTVDRDGGRVGDTSTGGAVSTTRRRPRTVTPVCSYQ